jgi:hypothetical protein
VFLGRNGALRTWKCNEDYLLMLLIGALLTAVHFAAPSDSQREARQR